MQNLLPKGWTIEPYNGQMLITRAGGGFVTVSFAHRNFAAGAHLVHLTALHAYSGRNWRNRLLKAAISHLQDIYKDEENDQT